MTLDELFDDYFETENSRTKYLFNDENVEEWNTQRDIMYNNGVVLGKYRENDKNTLEFLKMNVPKENLIKVLRYYYQNDIKQLQYSGRMDVITKCKIDMKKIQLRDLSVLSIDKWIKIHAEWIIKECENKGNSNINNKYNLLYLYYKYDLYKLEINLPYSREQENIKRLYYKMQSYSKYELVPIDQDRKIMCIEDLPRIYDKNINKTIFLKKVPNQLAFELKKLQDKGEIMELAVRLNDKYIFNGKCEIQSLLEEMEFGKKFFMVDFNKTQLTKLYSHSYENCLWIKIDDGNMTFEELCEDFMSYNEEIITQVVHLEYRKINGCTYITHIDHEYIFYSIEEYEKRIKDANQKGNSLQRIKSFKVDNSLIPLDLSIEVSWKDENKLYKDSILFLHFVLENYFKHKELLYEYFENFYESGSYI